MGFVMDKVALGQVFSQYFGFPCQFSFHQLLQKSSSFIIGVCTIGQSGRSTRDLDRYLGTQYRSANNKKIIKSKMHKHSNLFKVTISANM
jgi:hypothetical protein